MLSLIKKLFTNLSQNKRFIEAAKSNRLDKLKNLLDQGADIHANNDEALRWSALIGHLDTVKFLTAQGADIHANDDDALRAAARNDQLETVKFLITQGANVHANDDEALRWSAYDGRLEIVKYLLARGANVHANNDEALRDSARRAHIEVFQVLSAFVQEKKLLVAASDSMPLVAVSDSTGASSCFCGILVLPSASTWVCGTAVASVALVAAIDSVPQTQTLSITKTKRPKI